MIQQIREVYFSLLCSAKRVPNLSKDSLKNWNFACLLITKIGNKFILFLSEVWRSVVDKNIKHLIFIVYYLKDT
jgi:hypothetical protein